MTITAVEVRAAHLELARPYTISFRTIDAVDIVIVELQSAAGPSGVGTATPEPHVTGESIEACEAALADLVWLEGRSAHELGALGRELRQKLPKQPAARAAIDMALHDLRARELKLPLVDVLGRAHESLPTSITIGIGDVAATLADAREYLARGFTALKVKLGHSLSDDLERLRELRSEIGPEVTVRVDPNQGYDLEELRQLLSHSRELGIEFVEQPLPTADDARLADLDPSDRDRIALDESLLDDHDALRLLGPPRLGGIYNIKLMKCGGPSTALRMADIADTAGIALMWGCMDESVVGISAALHVALASPATRYLDLDGSFDLAHDVAEGGFRLAGGRLWTLDSPGLGAELV